MAGAAIVADQVRPGPSISYGVPGVARNDLWVNRQIQLHDGAGGNHSWEWTLLSAPPGSAATLANHQTADPTFTPDLAGSYRIQFITNGGGPGNIQIRILRVRFNTNGVLVNRGWALPAYDESAGEANYSGNLRDWAEAFDFIFADILVSLPPISGAPETGKFLMAVGDGSVSWEVGGGGGGSFSGDVTGPSSATVVVGLTHVTSDLTFTRDFPGSVEISVADPTTSSDGYGLTLRGGRAHGIGASNVPGTVSIIGATGLAGAVEDGGAVLLQGGTAIFAGAHAGPVSIFGGTASEAGSFGGSVTVDAGGGAGTPGFIFIGTDSAQNVTISRSGATTYVGGDLSVLGTNVSVGGVHVHRGSTRTFAYGVAGKQRTTITDEEIGAIVLDPSLFYSDAFLVRSFQFTAVLECAVPGQTCLLELFNFTDGVTVTTLSSSSTFPDTQAVALAITTDLPDAEKLYVLRLSRIGGTSSDPVTCKMARVEVIYL